MNCWIQRQSTFLEGYTDFFWNPSKSVSQSSSKMATSSCWSFFRNPSASSPLSRGWSSLVNGSVSADMLSLYPLFTAITASCRAEHLVSDKALVTGNPLKCFRCTRHRSSMGRCNKPGIKTFKKIRNPTGAGQPSVAHFPTKFKECAVHGTYRQHCTSHW